MRLDLSEPRYKKIVISAAATEPAPALARPADDDPREALDYLFPVGPMTEEELAAEFNRLFPPE
jgi:hypothetical protein